MVKFMAGKATTGPPARAQNRTGINYSKVPECDRAAGISSPQCCTLLCCVIVSHTNDVTGLSAVLL